MVLTFLTTTHFHAASPTWFFFPTCVLDAAALRCTPRHHLPHAPGPSHSLVLYFTYSTTAHHQFTRFVYRLLLPGTVSVRHVITFPTGSHRTCSAFGLVSPAHAPFSPACRCRTLPQLVSSFRRYLLSLFLRHACAPVRLCVAFRLWFTHQFCFSPPFRRALRAFVLLHCHRHCARTTHALYHSRSHYCAATHRTHAAYSYRFACFVACSFVLRSAAPSTTCYTRFALLACCATTVVPTVCSFPVLQCTPHTFCTFCSPFATCTACTACSHLSLRFYHAALQPPPPRIHTRTPGSGGLRHHFTPCRLPFPHHCCQHACTFRTYRYCRVAGSFVTLSVLVPHLLLPT